MLKEEEKKGRGQGTKWEERMATERKGRQEKGSHQTIISRKCHIGNCRIWIFFFISDAVRMIFLIHWQMRRKYEIILTNWKKLIFHTNLFFYKSKTNLTRSFELFSKWRSWPGTQDQEHRQERQQLLGSILRSSGNLLGSFGDSWEPFKKRQVAASALWG